jgi:hypothetical protein
MNASKSEEVILEAATATHWYRVCLTSGNGTADEEAILSEFSRLYSDHGAPREAALFRTLSRPRLTGNDLFFSPRAGQIASYLVARYAGKACSAPHLSELELLVGNEASREAIFSNTSLPNRQDRAI